MESMTDEMDKATETTDQAALNEEASRELDALISEVEHTDVSVSAGAQDADEPYQIQNLAERVAVVETLIFVSEEPLSAKTIAGVLKEDRALVEEAIVALEKEFNARNGGLHLREIAGGWQFATRPEHHEHVRAFLRSRPSAKLSLASLETLAVIAYRQPVTVPEILEIRGVQSPSAIKTLLDKKLIVAKGRSQEGRRAV